MPSGRTYSEMAWIRPSGVSSSPMTMPCTGSATTRVTSTRCHAPMAAIVSGSSELKGLLGGEPEACTRVSEDDARAAEQHAAAVPRGEQGEEVGRRLGVVGVAIGALSGSVVPAALVDAE